MKLHQFFLYDPIKIATHSLNEPLFLFLVYLGTVDAFMVSIVGPYAYMTMNSGDRFMYNTVLLDLHNGYDNGTG